MLNIFKKYRNYFAIEKYMATFAASNILKGGITRLFTAGFFYAFALLLYGVTPVRSVNALAALEVLDNGSVTPFFFVTKTIFF